jgi:hypothetical protein
MAASVLQGWPSAMFVRLAMAGTGDDLLDPSAVSVPGPFAVWYTSLFDFLFVLVICTKNKHGRKRKIT